jgi:hypothetical protein
MCVFFDAECTKIDNKGDFHLSALAILQAGNTTLDFGPSSIATSSGMALQCISMQ